MAGRCCTIAAATRTPTRCEPVAGLTPSRHGVEALDDPGAAPALVRRMLTDIARSNRWLGGARAARTGLARLLDPADRTHALTLLDVGTGAGDLPHALVRWAAHRGVALRPVGLERLPAAAALAHGGGLATLVACGGALPLRDRGVDLVLASQLAHHLDDAGTVALFRECARVARRGVIIADLHPSAMAGWAYRAVGPLLRLHPVTVADGVTSLARGRDAAALGRLARQAGIPDPHATTHAFARVVLTWRTAP